MRLLARLTFLLLLGGFLNVQEVLAARSSSIPKILSREEWGADELLGIAEEDTSEGNGETVQEQTGDNGEQAPPVTLSERVKKCLEAQKNYPQEFKMGDIVTDAPGGKKYLWPRRYSPEMKLIVLHHTGGDSEEEREDLAGEERVRAIYQWHTVKNGWGDIGYNYLIDRDGVIYEGRAGGDKVIGAHAYCANAGTVGIALIGNYLHELPPEAQLRSARWLLLQLTDRYKLDPKGFVAFHGNRLPTIAMHKDLASTECPGRVDELVPAIRRLVAARDVTSDMIPKKEKTPKGENTLLTGGSTRLKLPRRGAARISLTYKANERNVKIGEEIASVERSDPKIGLWQSRGENRVRLRNAIVTEKAIRKGERLSLQPMILAPAQEGT